MLSHDDDLRNYEALKAAILKDFRDISTCSRIVLRSCPHGSLQGILDEMQKYREVLSKKGTFSEVLDYCRENWRVELRSYKVRAILSDDGVIDWRMSHSDYEDWLLPDQLSIDPRDGSFTLEGRTYFTSAWMSGWMTSNVRYKITIFPDDTTSFTDTGAEER